MQASSLSPPTRSTSTPSSYTPLSTTLSFLTNSTFYPLKLAPPPATAKTTSRATATPTAPPMADRDRDRDRGDRLHPQQIQVHSHQQPYRFDAAGGGKSILPRNGPSTGQVLAVVTLLPVGGSLLGLAALTLIGSLIGLAVATPLLVIFSPVLVPAALLLAGAVAAFLTSGAFGLTGLSSLSWVFNSFRQATGQEPFDYAKRRVQEGTMYVGEKTKQVGETIKSTAQEGVGGHHAGGGAGATATAGGAAGRT